MGSSVLADAIGAIRDYAAGFVELLRDLTPERRKSRYGDIDFDFEYGPAWAAHIDACARRVLQGRSELTILHDGREYRLRITQNGKLILTA